MGYGPVINGKQQVITPWKTSWAHQEFTRNRIPLTEEQECQKRNGVLIPCILIQGATP